jgi:pimeloyl-ACP methyl ester carboxylesterase
MTAHPAEAPWRRRFRAAQVTLPQWARNEPDRLIYTSNADGKWELYAWDRAADTHRQVTDRPEGTTRGHIDPPGAWIWWFDDERGSELGRWMMQPFAGGEPRVAAPDLPTAYSAGLALGRRFAVGGLSSSDGYAIHLIRPGEPPRLLYQRRQPATVAGLSRDEHLLCISHAEHGDSLHRALRVIDLDGNTVADLWDGPGLGLQAAGWSPVRGDNRLLALHEREGRWLPRIWEPETGDVTDLFIDLPGDVESCWYPDASALLLVHDHRGCSELFHFDLRHGELDPLTANRAAQTGTVQGAMVRPDGEVWYGWSESALPPTVKALASAGGGPRKVGGLFGDGTVLSVPGNEGPAGVRYRHHSVDGVPIFLAFPGPPEREEGPGWVRVHNTLSQLRVSADPHPTILWIHGGPAAHDRDMYSPRVQAWLDHGYTVVLVNYRGSTGYGRAWRDAITGNPGFTELEDIAKVHDWVMANGIAQPGKVILAGGSWGGFLTLLGLGMQPERWSLGIAAVPVADYVLAFEDEMEPLKAMDRDLFGGSPGEIPDNYRERSPITYAERVRVPVFIIGGENDPRCPIRQIDRYVERLEQLGKPHQYYRFDAGHGSQVIEETIRQTEMMLAFAAAHLGTAIPK